MDYEPREIAVIKSSAEPMKAQMAEQDWELVNEAEIREHVAAAADQRVQLYFRRRILTGTIDPVRKM